MTPTEHDVFTGPFGSFVLKRFPALSSNERKQQPLQAWNAADEYLLHWLHEAKLPLETPTLVLNDAFGGLTTCLPFRPLWSQTDSYLATCAMQQNLSANHTQVDTVLLNSLQWSDKHLDLVIIQLPKQLALLEHQLYQLRPLVDENTRIIAAGMVKHWPSRAQQLFETIIGPSHTSLAKKKARLLHCQPQPEHWQGQTPYPDHYWCEPLQWTLHNHANVFSRNALDIGTRFLLEHLPTFPKGTSLIDLGCGNGVLGLQAHAKQAHSHIHFVDESYMAVESARHNAQMLFPDTQNLHFQVAHNLDSFTPNSVDIILNNPPFHQQAATSDHLAWNMFVDAKATLKAGGELWVVGNRHLDYHLKLKRLFGNCRLVSSNRKFVVLAARKH